VRRESSTAPSILSILWSSQQSVEQKEKREKEQNNTKHTDYRH